MMGESSGRNGAHRFNPAGPDEEYVYGSCCPGWHSATDHETAVEQWIESMQDAGIERVCCLLAGNQLDTNDSNVGMYRDAFGAENVCHAPVAYHQLVDIDVLKEDILPFLDESVEKRSPVVVHCLAGVGRTGQILAAWLVYGRGYEPEEAVDAVLEMGRDPREVVDQGNATKAELFGLLKLVAEQRA